MNEAELLFTTLLNCRRHELYLDKQKILDKQESYFISQALRRRAGLEPLQYILGKADFMGWEFKVSPDVFIPRPETEILVETAVNVILTPCAEGASAYGGNSQLQTILDLGTGSGCIAVALAKLLPNASIDAVDISTAALCLAKENAVLNKAADKIRFIQADLFKTYGLQLPAYDLIISNPPYVASAQINELQREIQFEPRSALDGGKDGLDFCRRIINEAPGFLKKDGFLIMEMGINQANEIKKTIYKSEKFKIIDIIKDYSNIDRVIVLRKI